MNKPRFSLLAGMIMLAAARKIEMGCMPIQNVTLPHRGRRAAAPRQHDLQRRRMALAGATSGMDNPLK
jgi:hypothetical protein